MTWALENSQIRNDLEFLCDVEQAGRLSGTDGAKKTAEYLAYN